MKTAFEAMVALRLCLLLGIVIAGFAPGPARALDPTRDLNQYKHTRWTITEGAPQGIYGLVQGPDGYLWIGGSEGVYRFDGVTFEHIPPAIPRAESWRVTAMLAARDGTIWVGYDNGKLATYRGGALRLDTSVPKIVAFTLRLAQTSDGTIWLAAGLQRRALLRRTGGRWQEIGTDWGLPDDWITDITATQDGSLWVTTSKAILLLRKGARRFEKVATPAGLAAVSDDAAGRIWFSDRHGTRRLSASLAPGEPLVATPEAQNTFDTRFDRDGNLWGITSNGLFRMRAPGAWRDRPVSERVETFTAKDGLTSDVATAFLEDREGNIWIGTSLGLDRFRAANVVVAPSIGRSAVWGYVLLGARNGTVYVGANDGVFEIRPGGRPTRIPGAGGETHDLCEAHDGSIWALQTGKVLRIRSGRIERRDVPFGRDRQYCAVDNADTLLIVSPEIPGTLLTLRSGRWYRRSFATFAATPQYLIFRTQQPSLALLGSGALIGLDDLGRNAAPILGDRLTDISTVYVGAEQVLFGRQSGISRLRGGRLQTIGTDRFPWLVAPTGFVETPTGQTWLIAKAGIIRLSSRALDRAFVDPAAPLEATILDMEDGLPNVQFRDGNRNAVRGGDGRLWFTTTGGVVWVDPARLVRNALPPPVSIRAMTVAGTRYRNPSSMRLAPGTSQLAIQYAGLSLSIPGRVRFRYRLEGIDSDWVDAGTRRDAYYTNLGPGTYRFRVIAANNDGVWNREGATLEFTIPPTFVQSIWFKLLVGIGGIGILAAAYLWRLRLLTARLQHRFDIRIAERERIARELHDTLLQGFQGLMLQIKAGVNRLPDAAARKPLDEALKQAQAVLIEGRDRVQELRTQDRAGDLAQALIDSASMTASRTGPEVQVTTEGEPRALRPLVLEEVHRIGEEAIRNAQAHAHAASIAVLLIWGRQSLRLSICDDGVGMPADILAHGERPGHFGLRGMRERAERIGGRLVVISRGSGGRSGGGTEVGLVVPARAAYSAQPGGRLKRCCTTLRGMWPGRRR
nr:triple tyrosine motif-containing protein [uncultured Sphingomonas sp.]